jgi:pyruvate/2-oxoacid:ferredoxin oxidoreductase beta subunit/Pyruvate/2-oxoacid:ferredoxin oxidoreductase gamma subunit
MTIAPIQIAEPRKTYKNERPFPFCPGCGHGLILNHLDKALTKLQIDPAKTVIVSDIGCVGLSDQYFVTNAFHGLHGRSITYATGIKLANPELHVIVFIGDGGTGIGGTHLINAARRNVDLTVLVFNNFNFGMTGGEHSVTTPHDAITATTRRGNPEWPLDICATVGVNGAGYVYRGTSFDKDLPDRMIDAIQHEGFSLLDIWELCTAYFVPNNNFGRKDMLGLVDTLGLETGLLYQRDVRDYAHVVREKGEPLAGKPIMPVKPIEPSFSHHLKHEYHLVLAGSAGTKVRSAAKLVGYAGVMSGLWVTQRDDYPVTVKTGHSISEIILGPEEIRYTGVIRPEALVLISQDGLKKSGRYLAAMTEEDVLFTIPQFADVSTRARKIILDPKKAGIRVTRTNLALLLTTAALRELDILPIEAVEEAVRRFQARFADQNLPVVAASQSLLSDPQS